MAETTISDMQIFNTEFYSGSTESVAQATDFLNANSLGAITYAPNPARGDFKKAAFWNFVDLVGHRDDTSTSAQTPETMGEGLAQWVKVKRMAKVVRITEDALKSTGRTLADAVRAYGQQVGQQKVQDALNLGLIAANAAVGAVGDLNATGYSAGAMSRAALNAMLGKMGDRRNAIRVLAMHSSPYAGLLGDLITSGVSGLEDTVSINGAIPATLGKSVIVTDSPAFVDDSGSDTLYATLGLVQGAITLEESDLESFAIERVTGLGNIAYDMQAEWAITIGIKGFAWNDARNPSDANLAVGGNWAKVATSHKDCAGVRVVTL